MRVACLFLGVLLAGCGSVERMARIGHPPDLAPIADPTRNPDYRPVSMPMPAPQDARNLAANSLWRVGKL